MKVSYAGESYVVSWKHERVTFCTPHEEITETKGGETYCTIKKGFKGDVNTKVVSEGTSVCNRKDTYCRGIGRKLSLTKALGSCGNKEFRKAVWVQYIKECN